MTTPTTSFAQHADPSKGFNAVPRWLLARPEYRAMPAAHRAVVLTLYFLIRRVPGESHRYSVLVGRGQWIGTWDYLAKASGSTKEQARRATRKAVKLGMIAQAKRRGYVDGRTADYLHFTWVDFEVYDNARTEAHIPAHTPAPIPAHSVRDTPAHTTNTLVTYTVGKDTETDTDNTEEEGAEAGSYAPASCSNLSGESDSSGVAVREIETGPVGHNNRTTATHPEPPQIDRSTLRVPKATPSGTPQPARNPATPPKATPRPTATKLDPSAVLQSAEHLTRWLLKGAVAVETTGDAFDALPYASGAWCKTTRDARQVDEGAGVPQLAAYAAYRIAHLRAGEGLPLTMPNMGKLIGAAKNLVKARGNAAGAVAHINRIADNWPTIKLALGRFGDSLAPDELTFAVPQVTAQADRLAAGQTITPHTPAHAATESGADHAERHTSSWPNTWAEMLAER